MDLLDLRPMRIDSEIEETLRRFCRDKDLQKSSSRKSKVSDSQKTIPYVFALPAFQRCLEDGPNTSERQPRSGFPTGRGTGDGHVEAHHDLQA
ncbi:conserved hypothetical protein [Ricinus communis]|uniref:Uncharacterized protein n=1 Tax=Ricinus communis TaxID=3988 RepID=B9RQ42_RICCO|nr:conserved hypothetical protein [Ricinus communis]